MKLPKRILFGIACLILFLGPLGSIFVDHPRVQSVTMLLLDHVKTIRKSLAAPPILATHQDLEVLLAIAGTKDPGLHRQQIPAVNWIDSKPYCKRYPKHCDVYKEDIALIRDWYVESGRKRSRYSSKNPHPKCPSNNNNNSSSPVLVHFANFPWGDFPPARNNLEQCPVKCSASFGSKSNVPVEAAIVVGGPERFVVDPDQLQALVVLEHYPDIFTSSGLAAFDIIATWQRISDVYINYFYAWTENCSADEKSASANDWRCLRPVPSLAELQEKKRLFAVGFISNCGSWAWWWTQYRGNTRREFYMDLKRALRLISPNPRHRMINYGTCDRTINLPPESHPENPQFSKIEACHKAKFSLAFESTFGSTLQEQKFNMRT